jgi:hypothetical protein
MVEHIIIATVFLLQNLFRGSEAGVNIINIKEGKNIAIMLDHFSVLPKIPFSNKMV